MNKNNRDIIITLCSYLCVGDKVKPYTNNEWSTISSKLLKNKKEPSDLLNFTDEDFEEILDFNNEDLMRIKRLFARTASLAFEIEKLNNKGINLITRADDLYPKVLKKKLGFKCPPIFYYCGNLKLLKNKFIGFVGSRAIDDKDIEFTQKAVEHYIKQGYSIVSGGAKGIDRTATSHALVNDGIVVEYLSDSLIRRIKDVEVINAIRNDKLLLLSQTIPSAGFDVGTAMQRNKYIYCTSDTTIIIKSDLNKGGTWAGAMEALKYNLTNVCCWNNSLYKGNQALIEVGAFLIDSNLEVKKFESTNEVNKNKINNEKTYIQMSLFDNDK